MYTNSLLGLGTAHEKRHIWTPTQAERLEQCKHDDEYTRLPCQCRGVSAIHEPDDEDQQALRLVRVREYGIESLAHFLVHPDTDGQCARQACETLGLEWPPEELDQGQEALEPPEWVAQEFHEAGTEEVRSQWYDEAEDENSEALQEALDTALDRVRVNDHGKPMHAFLRGMGDQAVCGQDLKECHAVPPEEQGLWQAAEHWDTLGALLDDWLEGGDSLHCTECAEGLADQTETLRGFQEDALLRFASMHQPDEEDLPDAAQYAAFVEYGGEGQGSPAAVKTGGLTVDNDIQTSEAARNAATQGLQQGQVEHEMNISVDLSQEEAEKLARLLGDRVAGDRR